MVGEVMRTMTMLTKLDPSSPGDAETACAWGMEASMLPDPQTMPST